MITYILKFLPSVHSYDFAEEMGFGFSTVYKIVQWTSCIETYLNLS